MKKRYKLHWEVTASLPFGRLWYAPEENRWCLYENTLNIRVRSHRTFRGHNAAKRAKGCVDHILSQYNYALVVLCQYPHSKRRPKESVRITPYVKKLAGMYAQI